MDDFEHQRLHILQAEEQVRILQGTIRTLRADKEREKDRLRPLLERCEALVRAQLHLNQRLRRPDDEAGALLGSLLADLRRELGLSKD